MKPQKFTTSFENLSRLAVELAKTVKADALLVLLDGPADWQKIKALEQQLIVLVAAENAECLIGAAEAGLQTVTLDMGDSPIHAKLARALLEGVADDILRPGSRNVALYSAFEPDTIDSISVIDLGDHLGRLTVRDLQQLETSVPLDTLKHVVDLALEIGREGREGKPVGTLFVVGDHRKVMTNCHPTGFDPVKGYSVKERRLSDARVREGIKEVAQMDGAFVITTDGIVAAACQYVDASAASLTLSKGLGARHWAAAAISRKTKAIAVAVSESSGTVRIFQNGEVMLRIEPFRRAMKWTDFDFEPPPDD
ncbi:MAG: DNA integrity scanning protein DisA nucleotide-binding domain protein [Pirellulales bacterium]